MASSIYIGQIFGTFLFVVSIAFLLDSSTYKKVAKEVFEKPGLATLRAMISFLVGLIMVVFHNYWEQSWFIVITIVAWIVMLQGAFCLFFPKVASNISKSFSKGGLLWFYWIALVVGAYLMYMSFIYSY